MSFSIQKAGFFKNPFIGLYLKTNDRHTLVSKNAPAKLRSQIKEVLQTDAVELFINQSPLIGLFCVMNQTGIVLSANAETEEKKTLKKLGYNVYCLKSSLAPGNVLLTNNHVGLASTEVPQNELESIGECLGVPMHQHPLSGMHTLGAMNVLTDKGLFAYNDVTDVEFKFMEKLFGVHGTNGTTNNGVPFNAFGVVANNKGALLGEMTSGFETQRVYEALSGE